MNSNLDMTTNGNESEDGILCRLLCAKMGLISEKGLIDFADGSNIPLRPETKFRVVYCVPCTGSSSPTASRTCTQFPSSALSASMIANNVLGYDGFMRLNKSKEVDAYLIENVYTNAPKFWRDERIVSISIGSKVYMHRYKPNSFFDDMYTRIKPEEDKYKDMALTLDI
ncbi:hypothetical protein Asppvi_003440 [Aspergillus pseudoviridinutans]|uniref:Uncharacterized protein n=1 Tax=Aspergillus pseudoviridinutans TaxID=1517512 RepID=A0A9P3ET27_9EURO|nr:uncharacterized protein Asppvi_003440 [Aspergillus pseudoviridinutans]GIJ84593.1 hypothetical protein Asppvi_003440 [Aspergillus pseudoviridinutans]